VRLPASQATPLAMVVNELLLNAVEHGLKDRAQGTIRILLEDQGDAVQIEVVDDGAGLPAEFDPAQIGQTLGLQIVHTLVTDDLKGTLQLESLWAGEPSGPVGTSVRVTLPKRNTRSV
jgi:two-component sensor histidine kinase